jgi:hypothetical protein
MPATSSDSWLQMLAFGSYSADGNRYYSGSDPAYSAYAMAQDMAFVGGGTDHPYTDTITSRLLQSAGQSSPREIEEWQKPGALIDHRAAGKKPLTAQEVLDKLEHWKDSALDLPGVLAETARKTGSQVMGGVVEGSMNYVLILIGIMLLAVAAYSIVIPQNARSAIITSAVKGAV